MLSLKTIQCPYCWQTFDIEVDCSLPHQQYTEDCKVCCHPVKLDIDIDAEVNISIGVERES